METFSYKLSRRPMPTQDHSVERTVVQIRLHLWCLLVLFFHPMISLFLVSEALAQSERDFLNSATEDMLFVKGGGFSFPISGSSVDSGNVFYTVDSFFMSRSRVTVGEYAQFCYETGRPVPEETLTDSHLPITGISWKDANEYCEWLLEKTGISFRLPTHDEWIWAAARARNVMGSSDTTLFPGITLNINEDLLANVAARLTFGPPAAPTAQPGLWLEADEIYEWCDGSSKIFHGQESDEADDHHCIRAISRDVEISGLDMKCLSDESAAQVRIGFRLCRSAE